MEANKLVFFRLHNNTFSRYLSFSRKHNKGETVEQYHLIMKDLARNCNCRDSEETVIRDVLINKTLEIEVQRNFLHEDQDPNTALQTWNWENKTNLKQKGQRKSPSTRYKITVIFAHFDPIKTISKKKTNQCRNCGQAWEQNHKKTPLHWEKMQELCNPQPRRKNVLRVKN